MINLFSNYTFLIVVFGTTLLSGIAGMVGVISMLKGQSLIGDAISHSTLPGVVLAYLLLNSKNMLGLIAGAMIAGTIAYSLIQVIAQNTKVDLSSILAIILSTFFGIGMVLITHMNKNPKSSQSGISNFIFGNAATMLMQDAILIAIVSIIALVLLILFYKEIKVFVFDPLFAQTIGFHSSKIYVILLVMTMLIISVGLQAVGVIMISSMLVAPGVAAMQWSKKFNRVLILAFIVGSSSGFLGTYFSAMYPKLSTGALIVFIMSSIAILSVLFSPNGVIFGRKKI